MFRIGAGKSTVQCALSWYYRKSVPVFASPAPKRSIHCTHVASSIPSLTVTRCMELLHTKLMVTATITCIQVTSPCYFTLIVGIEKMHPSRAPQRSTHLIWLLPPLCTFRSTPTLPSHGRLRVSSWNRQGSFAVGNYMDPQHYLFPNVIPKHYDCVIEAKMQESVALLVYYTQRWEAVGHSICCVFHTLTQKAQYQCIHHSAYLQRLPLLSYPSWPR